MSRIKFQISHSLHLDPSINFPMPANGDFVLPASCSVKSLKVSLDSCPLSHWTSEQPLSLLISVTRYIQNVTHCPQFGCSQHHLRVCCHFSAASQAASLLLFLLLHRDLSLTEQPEPGPVLSRPCFSSKLLSQTSSLLRSVLATLALCSVFTRQLFLLSEHLHLFFLFPTVIFP